MRWEFGCPWQTATINVTMWEPAATGNAVKWKPRVKTPSQLFTGRTKSFEAVRKTNSV